MRLGKQFANHLLLEPPRHSPSGGPVVLAFERVQALEELAVDHRWGEQAAMDAKSQPEMGIAGIEQRLVVSSQGCHEARASGFQWADR